MDENCTIISMPSRPTAPAHAAAAGTLGAKHRRRCPRLWAPSVLSASTPAACSTPPIRPQPSCLSSRAARPMQASVSSVSDASHLASTTLPECSPAPMRCTRLGEARPLPDRPCSTTCVPLD